MAPIPPVTGSLLAPCRKWTSGHAACCCTSWWWGDTPLGECPLPSCRACRCGVWTSLGLSAPVRLLRRPTSCSPRCSTPRGWHRPAPDRRAPCTPLLARLPSDAALDPMRRLSRMMERTMRAEFSFPPDKPLRWGANHSWRDMVHSYQQALYETLTCFKLSSCSVVLAQAAGRCTCSSPFPPAPGCRQPASPTSTSALPPLCAAATA